MDKTDVEDGKIINDTFSQRLDMMARDIQVYGTLLAKQRAADLESQDPCFMARYRPS